MEGEYKARRKGRQKEERDRRGRAKRRAVSGCAVEKKTEIRPSKAVQRAICQTAKSGVIKERKEQPSAMEVRRQGGKAMRHQLSRWADRFLLRPPSPPPPPTSRMCPLTRTTRSVFTRSRKAWGPTPLTGTIASLCSLRARRACVLAVSRALRGGVEWWFEGVVVCGVRTVVVKL